MSLLTEERERERDRERQRGAERERKRERERERERERGCPHVVNICPSLYVTCRRHEDQEGGESERESLQGEAPKEFIPRGTKGR